jgi:RHS repeat-associated protein
VTFKDAGGTVTKTIQYTYDSSDRRISKKIDDTVTERYVYDGDDIALVFDGNGTQTHRYLYGIGVDQVLASERGGTVVWALSDNQGTVRDVVDGNGTILNHVVYDSFGKVVSQSDASVEFRYGYTGREQDGETGLDYYHARYYDSVNGRFISEDPIGFSARDGNLYRYVFNNSVNYIDPSGKDVWIEGPGTGQLGFHQKIVVGDINGKNNYAISFAPNTDVPNLIPYVDNRLFGHGIIYQDEITDGEFISRYMKTTEQQDIEIKRYFGNLVNQRATYFLPTSNCRKFSWDIFNDVKKTYGLTESRPPSKQSFLDRLPMMRKKWRRN